MTYLLTSKLNIILTSFSQKLRFWLTRSSVNFICLPIDIFVLLSEIFIKVSIEDGIGEGIAHAKEVQYCIDDRFVAGNQGLHLLRVHVHQEVEDVERQPRYKEDDSDATDHDIRPATFLIVFLMLAL